MHKLGALLLGTSLGLLMALASRLPFWSPSRPGPPPQAAPIGRLGQDAGTLRVLLAGERLDVNRATAADLDALPGVGPGLASRLVERRRALRGFRSLEELREAGIGRRRLERLSGWIVVGERPGAAPARPR